VRFKFRNVEADSPEEAISKVDKDNDLLAKAGEKIQRYWDKGSIEHIEMDDSAPLSGLVDLVGDEEYHHSVDFDADRKGRFVPSGPYSDIPPGILEKVAHEAAGSSLPTRGIVPDDVLSSAINTIVGGSSEDEREMVLRDMDHLISALTRARDAVAAIDMDRQGECE
jgi:hypothetical protein